MNVKTGLNNEGLEYVMGRYGIGNMKENVVKDNRGWDKKYKKIMGRD